MKEVCVHIEGKIVSFEELGNILGIPIETLVEYNKIADRGRYKGKPSPYGIGMILVDIKNFEKTLDIFVEKLKFLYNKGVDTISISIELDRDWYLSKEISKKIVKLDAEVMFLITGAGCGHIF